MAKIGLLVLAAAFSCAAAPLTNSGHPGPQRFTADDYDGRYGTMLQMARIAHDVNPGRTAMLKVADSRMKEYPSTLSDRQKRSRYARELKAIEQERDAKEKADSRRALEALARQVQP